MTRSRTLLLATGTLLAAAVAACGNTDDTSAVAESDARTIEIDMADNAFEPDTLDVTEGETVRFVFTNTGDVAHDAFVGDQAAQDDHGMEMSENDAGMEGHGSDGDAVTVDPGETGELTHTFEETGSLEIGCHQPGHYESGMKLALDVT
ncbi:MAG: cupredoxin domain-containing protein [Acidimicrobiales bacterium]